MSGGAIFVHGIDVIPYLIAGTFFLTTGGAFVIFWALLRALGFVK